MDDFCKKPAKRMRKLPETILIRVPADIRCVRATRFILIIFRLSHPAPPQYKQNSRVTLTSEVPLSNPCKTAIPTLN